MLRCLGSTKRDKHVPSSLLHTEYTEELQVATILAQKAGKNMKKTNTTEADISIKGKHDFVTKTDVDNEKIIFRELTAKFPTHNFIGEVTWWFIQLLS